LYADADIDVDVDVDVDVQYGTTIESWGVID
jgi:uncharacterized alkaline shock family protein YloU